MTVVIQLDGSRISTPCSERGKFWMVTFETIDVAHKVRRTVARGQIRMALRARSVAGSGQANRTSMIGMAGGTGGREHLRRVMNRSVVAREAFLIGDLLAEKACLRDVAGGALSGQHGVRGGQASRRVHSAVASYAIPSKPQHREGQENHRDQKSPTAQRTGSLEILQVDSLRQLLGCARSRHGQPLPLIAYE